MTAPLDLAAIRARCDAATEPVRWEVRTSDGISVIVRKSADDAEAERAFNDTTFPCDAPHRVVPLYETPSDVLPALLARCEALEAALTEARTENNRLLVALRSSDDKGMMHEFCEMIEALRTAMADRAELLHRLDTTRPVRFVTISDELMPLLRTATLAPVTLTVTEHADGECELHAVRHECDAARATPDGAA